MRTRNKNRYVAYCLLIVVNAALGISIAFSATGEPRHAHHLSSYKAAVRGNSGDSAKDSLSTPPQDIARKVTGTHDEGDATVDQSSPDSTDAPVKINQPKPHNFTRISKWPTPKSASRNTTKASHNDSGGSAIG